MSSRNCRAPRRTSASCAAWASAACCGAFPRCDGRAGSRPFGSPNSPQEAARHAPVRRAAAERALRAYAPGTLAVFDAEFGHTDPQLVTPYGGAVRVDGPARRVTVTY